MITNQIMEDYAPVAPAAAKPPPKDQAPEGATESGASPEKAALPVERPAVQAGPPIDSVPFKLQLDQKQKKEMMLNYSME